MFHKNKVILVDLDGVLNEYSGDFDENYIPALRDGALEFLKMLSKDFKIKIFTTRNCTIVKKWITSYNLDNLIIDVTNVKEPSYLIIDDRCLNFQGDYTKIINKIYNFIPWYQK